jgi:hypothetical protein
MNFFLININNRFGDSEPVLSQFGPKLGNRFRVRFSKNGNFDSVLSLMA